jgi:Ser/Thr protein kinase RdoA (MazF antagonist)
MTDDARRALALWGLEDAPCRFVAGRENKVYRVSSSGGDFALRLKRPGYRTDAELLSELQWLDAMDSAGLHVPRPQPALSGALLERIGSRRADLVSWLRGFPVGTSHAALRLDDVPGAFRRIGAEMARLHKACDEWKTPAGFVRRAWNLEGLLGGSPVWGRFWDNPTLDAATREQLREFRAVAADDLRRLAPCLDYGLIHADLVRENVLLDGQSVRLIDFDDGGWGFRLFDIATTLLKNRNEPDYPALRAALLEGYRSIRTIDTSALDLFLALRAASYVGWIVPRMQEEGSALRNRRFVEDACSLCAAYLAKQTAFQART